MTARVVLLDAYGTVDDVVMGLGGAPVETTSAAEVPSGPGVVALLAGPETPLTADDIRALPDLRIVAITSTGHDHVPVDAVARQGAWVTTSAGYCTQEVADHTIALVLSLLRGVTALDHAVRAGRWDVTEAAPRRIAGTVLGLVGHGRIGRAVGERAAALGMRVVAHDPRDPTGPTFMEVLGEADVVSLHLPLTAESAGMVDASALAAMKPGSYFVNTARGALVDHRALTEALGVGCLAGAALDVLPIEPLPPDDPLLDCPNLILNPHAAWYSAEALARPFRQAAAAVADVLAGREPRGAVARPQAPARSPAPAGPHDPARPHPSEVAL
jgi:D-3-phosphoglycerate dehydrogenase